MHTTSFECPHCGKKHGVREVAMWLPDSDHDVVTTQIEEADFYDTENLNARSDIKAELEAEYGRGPDFVVGPFSGWCLRPRAGEKAG